MVITEIQEQNGIKVGDYVAAYNAGYHQVIKIKQIVYDETDGFLYAIYGKKPQYLVQYKQIFTKTGKEVKSTRLYSCDILFCKNAFISLTREIEKLQDIELQLAGKKNENY